MQQNEIGTIILDKYHNPIVFNHPPLKKGVTYDQLKKLVKDLESEYNIKTKTTIDFILKEIEKLKKIEEYPICYLKASCKFQLTTTETEYPEIPYLDNIPNNTKLTDKELLELKTRLQEDYPLLDDIPIPYTEAQLFEKKRKLIQILYFQIEQEKNGFKPLNVTYSQA